MNDKLKINKGDIGVYVTFGLFFAGIGLVVGSYLASRKEQKEIDSLRERVDNMLVEVNYQNDVPEEIKNVADELRSDYAYPETMMKSVHETDDRESLEAKLKALEMEYELSEEDKFMVLERMISIEELRRSLEVEADGRDLGRSMDEMDDGIDMDDDGRFVILTSDPREDGTVKKLVKLVYKTGDEDTSGLYRVVSGRDVLVEPDSIIGDGTIDTVLDMLMFNEKYDKIYVLDADLERAYSVELRVLADKKPQKQGRRHGNN